MFVLAIDTSLNGCSVAVCDDKKGVCFSRTVETGRGQAGILIPLIQEVMKESKQQFSDLDLITFCHGPGSFTGLRISASTARTLGLCLNIPVLGVETLEVIAFHATGSQRVIDTNMLIVLETKRKDFYARIFSPDATPVSPPLALDVDRIVDICIDKCGKSCEYTIIGDATKRFARELEKTSHKIKIKEEVKITLIPPEAIAAAALNRFKKMTAKEIEKSISPLYLRSADTSPPKNNPRKLAV